jgi:hypothetical protein
MKVTVPLESAGSCAVKVIGSATFAGLLEVARVITGVALPTASTIGVEEEAPLKFESPEYCAVIECAPPVSKGSVIIALPLLTEIVPPVSGVPLSKKVMVPVAGVAGFVMPSGV